MSYVDVVGDCLAGGAVVDNGVYGQDRRTRCLKFADQPPSCGCVVCADSRSDGVQFEITWQVVGGLDTRCIGGADICNGDCINQGFAHISRLLVYGFGAVKGATGAARAGEAAAPSITARPTTKSPIRATNLSRVAPGHAPGGQTRDRSLRQSSR